MCVECGEDENDPRWASYHNRFLDEKERREKMTMREKAEAEWQAWDEDFQAYRGPEPKRPNRHSRFADGS